MPYPPKKQIFPLKASGEFASVYEKEIHPAIQRTLETRRLIPQFKELHPIRMGFEDEGSCNPIVILIIFEHGRVSVEVAKQIVLAISNIVDSSWKGEQYVF